NEGTADTVGCLWNSNVLFGEDGTILNHHRKLVPTFWEKLTWANGDGAGLRVCETPLGRIGMLICGENTNPLARFALMAQGEQVHVSTYPPVWPTRDPKGGGNYDLASAIRIRAGAHSFEAKAFNIVASGFMDAAMREELATLGKDAMRVLEESPRAVSMVIGPTGEPAGDALAGQAAAQIMTLDAAGDEPIDVVLGSGDGTLEAAFVLIDVIDSARATVRVHCQGQVGGPAIGVAAAADHRSASPHTTFRLS